MLSKNRLKYFSSLNQKKFRIQYGRFLAEGEKIVREILAGGSTFLEPVTLIAEPAFISSLTTPLPDIEILPVPAAEIRKISSLVSGSIAILELKIPDNSFQAAEIAGKTCLYFNDIRDPGNLGTIIRTADWFGISDIFCSPESVDTYNPKVVQSSMGSLCRVKIHYEEASTLVALLKSADPQYRVTGTVLNGKNIYRSTLPRKGLILFGNESQGLPPEVISLCDHLVTIPSAGTPWADSLNVSIATSIVCSEWHRNGIIQNENTA